MCTDGLPVGVRSNVTSSYQIVFSSVASVRVSVDLQDYLFYFIFYYEREREREREREMERKRERERGILYMHFVPWNLQWSLITPQQRSQVDGR